jgi:hypothetical protein
LPDRVPGIINPPGDDPVSRRRGGLTQAMIGGVRPAFDEAKLQEPGRLSADREGTAPHPFRQPDDAGSTEPVNRHQQGEQRTFQSA